MSLATDVHHKIPKRDGGEDTVANLEPLCHSCHSRITAKGG
ncbi:MAG: HNH endonuclease [Caldilinea sp.]|nr:HNH endonuclease [Caldilinea sp.]